MVELGYIFCFSAALFSYFFEKNYINPLTIFFSEWGIILFLSSLELFHIQSVSEEYYMYILWGCISYFLGYMFIRNLKYGNNTLQKQSDYKFVLNKKVVYFFSVVTATFFLFDFVHAATLLLSGQNLNYIRQRAQEGSLFSNPILNAIRILIAAPFSLALTPVVASNFFSKKRNNFLLGITIVILIERLLSDGGRSPIIYLLICIAISFLLYKQNNLKYKKKILKFSILKFRKKSILFMLTIFIGLVSLYYITKSRSGDNSLRYTYYYFAMEPLMFEKWSKIVSQMGLIAYGMASFNGYIFSFFYLMVNAIPIFTYPESWRTIYAVIENIGTQWQTITTIGTTANSYTSIFWTLYFDGRVCGIIIGMFLFGIFTGYFYKKVIINMNEKNLSLYCMIAIGVFYTFQQLIFQNIYWSLALIYILKLMYKKEQINENIDDYSRK